MDFSAHPTEEVATTVSGDQYTPVVAGLASGGYVVVWESQDSGPSSVWAQIYDAQGHRSGGQIALFADPATTPETASGFHVGGVAGLADGSFVVSAATMFASPAMGNATNLYAQRVDATGQLSGARMVVQQGTNDDWAQGGPVFALPNSGYAVIEQRVTRPQPTSLVSDAVHAYDASNTAVASFVPYSGWAPARYDIAATKAGGFVAASLSPGATPTVLSWEVTDSNGAVLSHAQYASQYGVTQYSAPAVVSLANGTSLIAWQLTTYDANGNIASSSWQAQAIGADGQPSGAVTTLGIDASAQYALQFTALAGGGFLATWPQAPAGKTGVSEILGEYFDASGHASGELIHLAEVPNSDLYYHLPYSIAATADGGFVFTADWNTGTTGLDVFEQKFDPAPDGTPGPYIDVSGKTTATAIGSGNFTIGGDGGTEQIAFASAHSAWSITPTTQGMNLVGPEGADLLVNVERVRFGDNYAIAFDISGHAGEAYRLYQAAFARAPDDAGLGFHIRDLDSGVPLWGVGQHFVDSPEFQTTYGSLDNTQFITLLYRNVLHRDPDSGGLQFHLNEFAQGETRADMLTHFSESPENQANVLGQISNGMWFVPLA